MAIKVKPTTILIILFVIGILYFSFYPTGTFYSIDKNVMGFGVLLATALGIKATDKMLKADSYQFISPTIHSAIDGLKPVRVGDWLVLIKDSVLAWGFHFEDSLSTGTIICYDKLLVRLGRNFYTPAFLFEVDLIELPPEVRDFFMRNPKKYKAPFYIGVATEKQLKSVIDLGKILDDVPPETYISIEELVDIMKSLDQQINNLKDLGQGNLNIFENIASSYGRIAHKISKKPFWERINPFNKQTPEENANNP